MSENLQHYKTFLTVAQRGSVSAAAKELDVSQPAVSSEISGLENDLGVKLFVRTNRGVALTSDGQILFDYVKKGIGLIDAGEDKLREIGSLTSGKLRIGVSDMTLRFFLMDYIVSFRERYPGINLTVTNAPTPKTLESLRSGNIDFGVVSEPFTGENTSELDFIPVREIQDIFIAHPTCPLARESRVQKRKLAEYPMNMLERQTSTRKYVSAWLGNNFPEPAIELATSDLLVRFAEQGLGISSVVEDFAEDALKEGKVVKINLAENIPKRKFYIACMHKFTLSAAARSMLDIIFETVDRQIIRGGIRHG